MNTKLLNRIADMIVAQCNKDGTKLADEFKSTEDFRMFVISFAIKSIMDFAKVDIKTAYNSVIGEGEYEAMVDAVYDTIKARQAA